eukprot:10518082-Prorocentrum_lima.AAC.1
MQWTNPWRYEEADDGMESDGCSDTVDECEPSNDGTDRSEGLAQQQRIQEWRRDVNREMWWLMYRCAVMGRIRRCLHCLFG